MHWAGSDPITSDSIGLHWVESRLSRFGVGRNRQDWIGSDQAGLDPIVLNRFRSSRITSDWARLNQVGSNRLSLDGVGSDPIGSDTIVSDRIGSDWVGSDRVS